MYDFSKVEVPEQSSYLKPGMWRLTPTVVELEEPEKGNPRVNVTFTDGAGASVRERFILTPKAIKRLQYLHEAWFGKKLEKAFSSNKQIGEYFKKALLTNAKEMPMIVGGEQAPDGKVYARLPFLYFIVKEDQFEEGAFEEGTQRWNSVVKRREGDSNIMSSDSAVLPSSASDSADDMPWEV
jgi:hypothetical protein